MKTAIEQRGMRGISRRGRRLEHAGARVLPGLICARRGRVAGFTLVELLVVITIMAIIASMVVGLGALASRKKHDAVVTAMKAKLALFISAYQSKMGFFPPDNTNNVNFAPGTTNYETSTGLNSLIYELTGATATGTNFMPFDGPPAIPATTFSAAYGRGGIANSLPDEAHVFYQPLPSPSEYMTNAYGLKQLVVPVDLNGNTTNFWHYDCSNPNRHNPQGFDLWAEYTVGAVTITNGNWNTASQ